jgi:hypothetical protein
MKHKAFLLTHDQVVEAIDKQMRFSCGLCSAFVHVLNPSMGFGPPRRWQPIDSYVEIPRYLRALGGRAHHAMFWRGDKQQAERRMMLAFMLTWVDELTNERGAIT